MSEHEYPETGQPVGGGWSWKRKEGYEVTTRGDRRFSAFVARLEDGRTIEQAYQLDVKGRRPTGESEWQAKGKPPLVEITRAQLVIEYDMLWRIWAAQNPILIVELMGHAVRANRTMRDRFARYEPNQAASLAKILRDLEAGKEI